MENLTFIHRGRFVSKRIIGGGLILFATFFLILERNSLKQSEWLQSILFFIWGALFFTPLFGSDKFCIESDEDNLKIKSIGWIREVILPDNEIEKITLSSTYILINRKSKKALRIMIDSLKKEQRAKVYEFLIEYVRQKNLVLVK